MIEIEYLKTFFTYDLFILFALTTLSSLLGNMKSILIVKDDGYKKYLATALDTVIFALIVKSISTSSTIQNVVVFTVGKVLGLLITDLIMRKLDNSIYLVNLYVDEEHTTELSEYLLENNISFTLFKGEFNQTTRYQMSIHLNKDQLDDLHSQLRKLEIDEPTMDMTTVKVKGKIKDRV